MTEIVRMNWMRRAADKRLAAVDLALHLRTGKRKCRADRASLLRPGRHDQGRRTCQVTRSKRGSPIRPTNFSPSCSFVPWCSGARIHRENQREIIADFEIGFGPFRESFTSQVTLDRPRQVLVHTTERGPLEHLTNTWTFTPVDYGTHVDFVIDFQFKSQLLDHVVNNMFHEAVTRMMGAFESRHT
jgi:ribosome-associated toxin RatA of RatAB toxin-antitoxin module